jgi:hypothetical protein
MAILEGRWDCSSCETKGILGRLKACPKCGNPRDESEDVYLPSDATAVTDTSLLELASAGVDWHCEHCGSDNRGDRVLCKSCGAQRGFSPKRSTEPLTAPRPPALRRLAQPAFRRKREPPLMWGIRIGAVVIAVVVALAVMLRTHTEPLTIVSAPWHRTIDVEVYRTVREGDWSVPPGGRERHSEQRVHHQDQVLVRYETRTRSVQVQTGTRTERYSMGVRNKGNGFYEEEFGERQVPIYGSKTETYQEPIYRDEPRYQTWYDYDIERWVKARTERASGSGPPAAWPPVTLGEKERGGRKDAIYKVNLAGRKRKQIERQLPEPEWLKYPVGGTAIGTFNNFGVLTRLQPPAS